MHSRRPDDASHSSAQGHFPERLSALSALVSGSLPAALEQHFPGQMDDFRLNEAAIVFLAEMDHIAVGARIEDDALVG